MNFSLLAPCSDCPFLREGGIRLTRPRVQQIAGMMLEHGAGGTFPCHKTAGAAGRKVKRSKWSHCAGALVFAEKNGVHTQAMQLATRLGFLDIRTLQGHNRVFDSIDEMLGTAYR